VSLQVSEQDGIQVVKLLDLADNQSAAELRDTLHGMVAEGRSRFVLDMELLPYINSLGIGVLVGALKSVTAVGGKLVLSGPRQHIRDLFASLRLDRVFQITATRREAIGALCVKES
jgi:anti-sigma B factor antagonist